MQYLLKFEKGDFMKMLQIFLCSAFMFYGSELLSMTRAQAYDVLNIGAQSSDDEVKLAYRKMSLKYHPDKQVGKTDEAKENAINEFQKVQEAYAVLTDKTVSQESSASEKEQASQDWLEEHDFDWEFLLEIDTLLDENKTPEEIWEELCANDEFYYVSSSENFDYNFLKVGVMKKIALIQSMKKQGKSLKNMNTWLSKNLETLLRSIEAYVLSADGKNLHADYMYNIISNLLIVQQALKNKTFDKTFFLESVKAECVVAVKAYNWFLGQKQSFKNYYENHKDLTLQDEEDLDKLIEEGALDYIPSHIKGIASEFIILTLLKQYLKKLNDLNTNLVNALELAVLLK